MSLPNALKAEVNMAISGNFFSHINFWPPYSFGQVLKVVGDLEELGGWAPDKVRLMIACDMRSHSVGGLMAGLARVANVE